MSDASEAYRLAGVDLELGNDVSAMLYEAAKHTWADRVGRIGEIAEYGTGFASFRGMPLDSIGATGYVLSASADGIGTKVEIAERMGKHDTMGHDLVAMSCDDAVVRGGEPFAIATVLDVRTFKDIPDLKRTVGSLAVGYVEAAKKADVTISNGETAELGNRIGGFGPFNYNWSSTALWLVHRDRIIDNTAIKPGNAIVALKEHGFRSNGLSLARKVFHQAGGEAWHEKRTVDENGIWRDLGELALRPSIIYSRALVDMTGGAELTREAKAGVLGAAHVTGGGIPEKLGRVLANTGYGAFLDELYRPPSVMRIAQEEHTARLGILSDEASYRTWNMGQGMLIVTDEPNKVIAVAEEHDLAAKVAGEVTKEPGIQIRSQGQLSPGRVIEFAA